MKIELNRNSEEMQIHSDMDNAVFEYFFNNSIAFNILEDSIDRTVFEIEDDEKAKKAMKHLTFLKLMYS